MKEIIDPRSAFERYETVGGIAVSRSAEELDRRAAVETVIDALHTPRGVLLSSGYDYPGRYTRWDLGLVAPPPGPERARERPPRTDPRSARSAPGRGLAHRTRLGARGGDPGEPGARS